MNASSLLPVAAAPVATLKPAPTLTPEQLAQREAIAVAIERAALLRKVAALKGLFEANVLDIQKLLDKNPRGLTREQILASLTPEQREAFAHVAEWAYAGLAAFSPPAPAASAPATEEPAPASEG